MIRRSQAPPAAFRMVAVLAAFLATDISPLRAALPDGLPVRDLAKAIERSHRDLFAIPGGIRISFELHVDQDPIKGTFLWESGTRGEVSLRWPRLHCKIQGHDKQDHRLLEREGEYNLETKLGAGRDRLFVQITPYRQAWSAAYLFPLRLMFFDEADQYYVPGRTLTTKYSLPSALEQGGFRPAGSGSTDGIICDIYTNNDGSDELWVAPEKSFVVCRREIRDPGSGKLRERVLNSRFRNLHPGIWLPTVLVQEKYREVPSAIYDDHRPLHTIKVTVTGISLGNVSERELHITIPSGSLVDDQIADVTYRKTGEGEAAFASAIKQARFELQHGRQPVGTRYTTLILEALLASLTLITVGQAVWLLIRRSRSISLPGRKAL